MPLSCAFGTLGAMDDFRPDPRTRARDAGLVRLKRMTRGMLFAATALAGVFAGLAAHSFAGHKARAAPATTRTVREVQTQTQRQTQSEQDDRQTTTQATPVTTTSAPTTTTVAPVAVSGAT
jgi:apolipoprotein N-acyltransferase